MINGQTRCREVATGRAPPHPVDVLEAPERSFACSRQWQEVLLGFRRFG
jgi:hypothetical protein